MKHYFPPFSPFQGLSHRNLAGNDITDCSFIFLYILCTMSIRQNIQKILGFAPSRAASKQNAAGGGFFTPPSAKWNALICINRDFWRNNTLFSFWQWVCKRFLMRTYPFVVVGLRERDERRRDLHENIWRCAGNVAQLLIALCENLDSIYSRSGGEFLLAK